MLDYIEGDIRSRGGLNILDKVGIFSKESFIFMLVLEILVFILI